MRTTKTFSVLLLVKAKKGATEEGTIYARITVNQKRAEVSLKRKISRELWDSRTKRAKGHSVQARRLNQYLDLEHSRFFQCYQELRSKGKKITSKLVKASYLGEEENTKTLKELMEYHCGKIENTLSFGSIRNFAKTEGFINKFLSQEKHASDVLLRELDYKFLCDFETFLQEYYPKKYLRAISQNSVMQHIQRLREIITFGYYLEWIDEDSFLPWKN